MKLGADSIKKIADLFSSRNQYRIPLYQRRYVWDKANWETLWRDLVQLQRQIDNGEKDKKHFTGTIVTHAEKDSSQENWDIIDGQQRLTTFQVIFSVIHDLCASKAYLSSVSPDFLKDVKGFTKLTSLEMEETNIEQDQFFPYRLTPAGHDRDSLYSVISGEIGKDISEQSDIGIIFKKFQSLVQQSDQNRVIMAYGYFGVAIMNYLGEEDATKLLTLTHTLANNFRVIKVDLVVVQC